MEVRPDGPRQLECYLSVFTVKESSCYNIGCSLKSDAVMPRDVRRSFRRHSVNLLTVGIQVTLEMKRVEGRLSHEDQSTYLGLRKAIGCHGRRDNRNRRLPTLSEMLATVVAYCQRPESYQWKQWAACGSFPCHGGFAVNTHELECLLD
jgi:hypothetical protein